jgi:hypothetical protein
MHTITLCPRCNQDFMYHSTDVHLSRNVTIVDEVGNNEVVETVICQNCDLFEKWVHKEVKVKKDNAHEHLNQFRLFVVDIDNNSLDFPITVKVGDTDSYEWFTEDELEIVNI